MRLTQDDVDYLLDVHTEPETEQPLVNVIWNIMENDKNNNISFEFMDIFLDDLSENATGSDLADFIYDIQNSPEFNVTDKFIKIDVEFAGNVYDSADRIVDLFTNEEWYEMLEKADIEVVQPLLDEVNKL